MIPVAGDITEHELGISEADQAVLIKNVSIVFHSAATVKFDEALKLSVTINMVGTKQLLNLCHRMCNLEVIQKIKFNYLKASHASLSRKYINYHISLRRL